MEAPMNKKTIVVCTALVTISALAGARDKDMFVEQKSVVPMAQSTTLQNSQNKQSQPQSFTDFLKSATANLQGISGNTQQKVTSFWAMFVAWLKSWFTPDRMNDLTARAQQYAKQYANQYLRKKISSATGSCKRNSCQIN